MTPAPDTATSVKAAGPPEIRPDQAGPPALALVTGEAKCTASGTIDLEPAFWRVAEKEIERILPWFHQTPMVVTPERYDELHRLQQLLFRAIRFFVEHCAEYDVILTLTPKGRRIIEMTRPYPYRVGTYRPDFLISEDGELRICEINARFPLNGYFVSSFSESIATRLAAAQGLSQRQRENLRFLDYLPVYWGAFERVCVLKSPADKPQDLRCYVPNFESNGIPCTVIAPGEISEKLDLLTGAAVINEFNQMDLEALDDTVLARIAASNALNDLRTIFLIHDKRLLAVLSSTAFLSRFLDDGDVAFLVQHVVPTYTRSQRPDLWEQARVDKDNWLLKPFLLGKSQDLLAGCVTDSARWQEAIAGPEVDQMVLQPFVRQKRFRAVWNGRVCHDYVVGTFLCFDQHFFGPGIGRASSFPVTNQGDDRKVSFLIAPVTTVKTDFSL